MVPELPKRLFNGEEVLWITGWSEGLLRNLMRDNEIAPVGGYHAVHHRLARIEEIQFTAHEIAATCEWREAVVADLWQCAEKGIEGISRSSCLPKRLITGDECLQVMECSEGTLRESMDGGWITPEGGYGPFGRFTNLDELQFTAREIAAACAWDEGAITDLWAISGETRPGVAPETDGQQDETPEMCVDRMRREKAGDDGIVLHLYQELQLKERHCARLVRRTKSENKEAEKEEAARSRVRNILRAHGLK